jgi:hypothetical protein
MRGRQPCISAGSNASVVQAMTDMYTLYNIAHPPIEEREENFILNKYAVILSVLMHLF